MHRPPRLRGPFPFDALFQNSNSTPAHFPSSGIAPPINAAHGQSPRRGSHTHPAPGGPSSTPELDDMLLTLVRSLEPTARETLFFRPALVSAFPRPCRSSAYSRPTYHTVLERYGRRFGSRRPSLWFPPEFCAPSSRPLQPRYCGKEICTSARCFSAGLFSAGPFSMCPFSIVGCFYCGDHKAA